MARKYGDCVEIHNCIGIGLSDRANVIRAIYVRRPTIYTWRANAFIRDYARYLEDETLENLPNVISGYEFYIHPEDRDLVKQTKGYFIQTGQEGVYWLKESPGITKNVVTMNHDNSDIIPGDIVIKRGSCTMLIVAGKQANSDYYLLVCPKANSINEYIYFEEVNINKLFKISRRTFERQAS